MPHIFLMDEDKMREDEACLLRCKLHLRGGKTLLDHHKIIHAIGTLYDAIEYGMRWRYLYEVSAKVSPKYVLDPRKLYHCLKNKGIFQSGFDFEKIADLMARALEPEFDKELENFDKEQLWEDTDTALTDLGIMPFNWDELPEENEATRKILGIAREQTH